MTFTDDEAARWLSRADPITSDAPLTTEAERTRVLTQVRRLPVVDPAAPGVTAPSRGDVRDGASVPERIGAVRLWRPRIAIAAGVIATILVAIIVVGPSFLFPSQAQALTPEPLSFSEPTTGTDEMLERLRNKLRTADADGPLRQAEYTGWYLSLDYEDGEEIPEATWIAPQKNTLTWEADLSGTEVVEAAESYWTDPNDVSTPEEAPPAGTILWQTTFAPGEVHTLVPEPFGESPEDVLAAIRAYGLPEEYTAADLVDALEPLMAVWTLTPAQHSAVLTLIGEAGDVRLLGSTTDRLGRTVIGFGADSTRFSGWRRTLLVEESSGLIVGVEHSRITPQPPLPAGAVASYRLWEGAQ